MSNVFTDKNMKSVFRLCNMIRIIIDIIILIIAAVGLFSYEKSEEAEHSSNLDKYKTEIMATVLIIYVLFDLIIRLFFSHIKWVQIYMLYTCFVKSS